MVRPLIDFREVRPGLGIRVSGATHASHVTHTPLGISLALGKASKLTIGVELSSNHDFSLRLGHRDRLVEQLVDLSPVEHVAFVKIKVTEHEVDVILSQTDLVLLLDAVVLLDSHITLVVLHLEGGLVAWVSQELVLDVVELSGESSDLSLNHLVHLKVLEGLVIAVILGLLLLLSLLLTEVLLINSRDSAHSRGTAKLGHLALIS